MIHIKPLSSELFDDLMKLEELIWLSKGEATLCPHFVRLCTEFYADVCFLAYNDREPIGYILNFLKKDELWCATMAVTESYRGSKVLLKLLTETHRKCDELGIKKIFFTVTPENKSAIRIHERMGAKYIKEMKDYYGKDDVRLLGVIERHDYIGNSIPGVA